MYLTDLPTSMYASNFDSFWSFFNFMCLFSFETIEITFLLSRVLSSKLYNFLFSRTRYLNRLSKGERYFLVHFRKVLKTEAFKAKKYRNVKIIFIAIIKIKIIDDSNRNLKDLVLIKYHKVLQVYQSSSYYMIHIPQYITNQTLCILSERSVKLNYAYNSEQCWSRRSWNW